MLLRNWLIIALALPAALAANAQITAATNLWVLPADQTLESVSLVVSEQLLVEGQTFDDTFWVVGGDADLKGKFGNDVWLLATIARLNGGFADHARVLAQTVHVDGIISNGLWAAGGSIITTTNSILYGRQLLISDSLTLNGHIEGDVYARAHRVTIGGTIVGDIRLYGDDIVIRPGTTVIGDLVYVTTNQSIVLDANSHVSGTLLHMEEPAISLMISPKWIALLQVFWFSAALLVGIPFILLFPNLTGQSVRHLRLGLWKCGLIGIATMFGLPFMIMVAIITVIGIPFGFVLGAAYGLLLYLGKFTAALAIGTAVLGRRGQISLSGALLSLVCGLFLFYSMSLLPFVGASLQTAATAFGAGSLILTMAMSRGRIKEESEKTSTSP